MSETLTHRDLIWASAYGTAFANEYYEYSTYNNADERAKKIMRYAAKIADEAVRMYLVLDKRNLNEIGCKDHSCAQCNDCENYMQEACNDPA